MSITKIVDGQTSIDAAGLNVPLYEIEAELNKIKSRINDLAYGQSLTIQDVTVKETTVSSRVVYFNNNKWEAVSALNEFGELITNFPMGIITEVRNYKGKLYLAGRIASLDASITESGTVEIGQPYFLSSVTPGKITTTQPNVAIHIGQFISANIFLASIYAMTNSHAHRRLSLTPAEWEDHTDYLLYPIEELPQLPLPLDGLVMCLWGTYTPPYGTYEVTTEGIRITDLDYFGTLLGVAPSAVYGEVSTKDIECFWSDPRTLIEPGVMSLTASTSNLVLNKSTGIVTISNIPVISTPTEQTSGATVVKSIVSQPDGSLKVLRGDIVERIEAGDNISINSRTGKVRISSSFTRIIELEFPDVFLKGAISKVFPNTINTYAELPYNRTTSVIYKLQLPYNLDVLKPVEIYLTYFGEKTQETVIPIIVRQCNSTQISNSYNSSTFNLPVNTRYLFNKVAIGSYVIANKVLYIQIERNNDTGYLGYLGLIGLQARIYIQ